MQNYKENEKQKVDIGVLIKESLQASTIHGIGIVLKSEFKIVKIIWVLFLIISSGLSIYFINDAVLEYLKYEVTTVSRKIYENEYVFPTITICNKNVFSTEEGLIYLKKNIGEDNFKYNIDQFLNEEFALTKNISYKEKIYLINKFDDLVNAVLSEIKQENMKKMFSTPISNMLLRCSFIEKPCNESDFVEMFLPHHGYCFRFNAGIDSKGNTLEKKKFQKANVQSGLTLELYVGLPNQLSKLAKQKGVELIIHESDYIPSSYTEKLIQISPNIESNVIIDKKVIKKIESPHSNCTYFDLKNSGHLIDKNYHKILSNNNFKYSREFCLDICYEMLVIKKCNCRMYTTASFLEIPNVNFCKTQEQLECDISFYREILNSNLLERNCLCPSECVKLEFDTHLTFSHYPTDFISKAIKSDPKFSSLFLNQSDFEKKLENNILKINIFTESLSYTQFQELPKMSPFDLVSSIGGILGLFLGMSLISLTEVLEILLKSFLSYLYNKNKFVVN